MKNQQYHSFKKNFFFTYLWSAFWRYYKLEILTLVKTYITFILLIIMILYCYICKSNIYLYITNNMRNYNFLYQIYKHTWIHASHSHSEQSVHKPAAGASSEHDVHVKEISASPLSLSVIDETSNTNKLSITDTWENPFLQYEQCMRGSTAKKLMKYIHIRKKYIHYKLLLNKYKKKFISISHFSFSLTKQSLIVSYIVYSYLIVY